MALEAVQAQAGHVSIESTRIYLHLTNDWLANEYHQAWVPSTPTRPSSWPWCGDGPVSIAESCPSPGSRRTSPTGSGPCSRQRRPSWPRPCAANLVSSPPSSRLAAWTWPTRHCASWPGGWWRRPTWRSCPTSPGPTSRTTRCGWPPSPAAPVRPWPKTPSVSGCG